MASKAIQIIVGIYKSTTYQSKVARCPECGEYSFILTSRGKGLVEFNCDSCYRIFENFEPLLVPLEQVSI
jgi:tRNA(Ile2) C34 agmatinyltransferase TiaS